MVNKKGLWFLTLFGLILVLSVYYVTLPEELIMTNANQDEDQTIVDVEEKSALETLRIESDAELEVTMKELQDILTNVDSTIEEKNAAFEQMKELNNNKSLEQDLEKKIKETYNLESFIKINGTDIQITINSDKHDKQLANNIMRTIQENFDTKQYISVKFQS